MKAENGSADLSSFAGNDDPDIGQLFYTEDSQEYYTVTIKAERYLKDATGTNPDEITFLYINANGIFFIKGIKTYVENNNAIGYRVGERALFFIYPFHEERDLNSNALLSKFVINSTDNTVQSAYLEQNGELPQELDDFEVEINQVLAASPSY